MSTKLGLRTEMRPIPGITFSPPSTDDPFTMEPDLLEVPI